MYEYFLFHMQIILNAQNENVPHKDKPNYQPVI